MFNRIKRFRLTLAFVVLAVVATGMYKVASTGAAGTTGTQSVIVLLRDDPAAVYRAKIQKSGGTVSDQQLQAYRDQLRATQDQFLSALNTRGVTFSVDSVDIKGFDGATAASVQYRYTMVLNGIGLTVPKAAVSIVKSMPQVKSVSPNTAYHVELSKSVKYIDAPRLYGSNPNDMTPFASFPDGNEGQGVYVAVLDTGIDWTHPMFGGDPTPPRLGVAPASASVSTNQKVAYYLPLAGTIDDFGHGTHCSADIAGYLANAPGADGLPGTADDIPIHGVAPQAKLMGYKVCAGIGVCLGEPITLALEDAVSPVSLTMQPKPIANVINMSLGGSGTPDDATSQAADNAALTGTVVVAAAGNSGPGEATVGSPAAGRHVIAAAASNDPATGDNTLDVADGSRTGMTAIVMDGSPAVTGDITNNYVYCGLGETPADFPSSVSGKIALIQRGSTITTPTLPVAGSLGTGLFTTKAANAAAAGAVAAVIFNNTDGELSAATVRKSVIPTVGLSQANGLYLKSIIGGDGTGVSAKQIRINAALLFQPSVADFSSRGPVSGLGQIKPDVSAPGVNILSATVPVGAAETNTGTMFDPSRYIRASGTSFACPHTAGAVALIKQAHPDWSPDIVRTALINTASNLRSESQVPKADGLTSDSIIAQGAGLIDVYNAVHTKALMGIAGDGIVEPSILGSASFGAVPVINSRVTHTETKTVTIQDISGQGGTYNLAVANNRYLEMNGITATTSAASVTVPANGSTTFSVSATVDGNVVRDTTSAIEMQFYVTAQSAGGSVRMPFYMQLTPTVPQGGSSLAAINDSGTILVGDNNSMLVEGVDSQSFPVQADAPGAAIDVTMTFDQIVEGTYPDLDLYLYDPAGNEVTHSGNGGGPEHIATTLGAPGTYVLRASGWVNHPTDFTITGTISRAAQPPTLQAIAGEFTDAQGNAIDFDGNYTIQWSAIANAQKYEIEQSTDGANYQVMADVDPSVTSQSLTNQADGQHFYRVRALTPGQIGYYVTPPSGAQSIIVNHRSLVDITSQVKTAISNVSLAGGVFSLDLSMTNNSSSTYVPYVKLNVIGISSASGTVRLTNADNGGSGVSASNAALFDYTSQLGSDQQFSPNEATGVRTMKFADSASELFQFDVDVTAFLANSSGGGGGSAAPAGGGSSGTQSSSNLSSLPGINLQSVKQVMRITVNPLTKSVTAQLVLK
jgi:minor extracellular serine protease Vpr